MNHQDRRRQGAGLQRNSIRKWAISIAVAAAGIAIAAGLFGPAAGFVTAAIAILWVTWRHDNQIGACLPLVLLLLIAIGVLMLLMYLLVVTHPA